MPRLQSERPVHRYLTERAKPIPIDQEDALAPPATLSHASSTSRQSCSAFGSEEMQEVSSYGGDWRERKDEEETVFHADSQKGITGLRQVCFAQLCDTEGYYTTQS